MRAGKHVVSRQQAAARLATARSCGARRASTRSSCASRAPWPASCRSSACCRSRSRRRTWSASTGSSTARRTSSSPRWPAAARPTRRALAARAGARVRRGRPHRRRHRPRRRGQDGDPRPAGVLHAGPPRPGRPTRASSTSPPRTSPTRATSGSALKLIGTAERVDGGISVRVHPAFLYPGHPLASVNGSFNAVTIESDAITEITLSGPGAGGPQTASAVLGDVISAMIPPASHAGDDASRCRSSRTSSPPSTSRWRSTTSPACWRRWPRCSGMQGASIKSVLQRGLGGQARLVMVLHPLLESRFYGAVQLIVADAVRPLASRARSASRRGVRVLMGLIDALPRAAAVRPGRPGRLAGGGLDAARARRARLRARRRRGLAQARGREPDRLLQGPRDDLRGVATPCATAPRP